MKIIHTVDLYNPFLCGTQQVIQQISERLVKRGHEVTVLTSFNPNRHYSELNGVKIEQFKIWGNSVVGIRGNNHEKEKYLKILLNSDYDILMNYATANWTTDLVFNILHQINKPKILAPCGYSPLTSPFWRSIYWRYFKRLPMFLHEYDLIIYHSNNYIDKIFGDKYGLTNYVIIPNAASEEEFNTKPIDFKEKYNIKTPYMLLTVGQHVKEKGHAFVINAFEKVDRDDLTLVIIGNYVKGFSSCYSVCQKKANLSHGKILSLANIPRVDTVSAFFDADIFLTGSKVECFPLVIIEAMASKTPFITTNVGNVNEIAGRILVRKPEEMAYYINYLIDNSEKRKKISIELYESWKKNYTWEKIVDKYEIQYKNMLVKCGLC